VEKFLPEFKGQLVAGTDGTEKPHAPQHPINVREIMCHTSGLVLASEKTLKRAQILKEAAWCCGSAGVYNITQPEQSADLLKRKVAHIQNTGAHLLAQSNPGCHLQIARGLKEAGSLVQVTQPVSLLAQAYRRERLGTDDTHRQPI
jgi:glycolate oxidase iron-sulfur subunit